MKERMKAMTRSEETKLVKNALAEKGIKATVQHGKGTAWGWLHVNMNVPKPSECVCVDGEPYCRPCKDAINGNRGILEAITEQATGRTGEYANILCGVSIA